MARGGGPVDVAGERQTEVRYGWRLLASLGRCDSGPFRDGSDDMDVQQPLERGDAPDEVAFDESLRDGRLAGTVEPAPGMLGLPPAIRQVIFGLAAIAALLTLLSLAALLYHFEIDPGPDHRTLKRLFSLDDEGGLQSWYQSSTLLACAVLLGVIAARERAARSRFVRHWWVLAAVFVYLSLDEAATIHELTMWRLQDALGAGGLLYFTWIVPAAALIAVLGVLMWRFLASLPRRILMLFGVAGSLYVGGAMGLEAIGGLYFDLNDLTLSGKSPTYELITTFEETLEMAGVLTFGTALAAYLYHDAGRGSPAGPTRAD